MNHKIALNSIIIFLGTWLIHLLGGWDVTLKILAMFIVIDYLTGLMKAYKDKELSSSVGFIGFLRKAAIFLVVIIATKLDVIIALENPIFRTMTVLFYTANEGISITENIALLGVPLPQGIVDALKKLKDDTEKDLG